MVTFLVTEQTDEQAQLIKEEKLKTVNILLRLFFRF